MDDGFRVATEITDMFDKKKVIRNGRISLEGRDVYYDRRYRNKKDGSPHPEYIKVSHNSGADIFIRTITTDKESFYQRVGKSSEILFSKPVGDTYSISDMFAYNELNIGYMTIGDGYITSSAS